MLPGGTDEKVTIHGDANSLDSKVYSPRVSPSDKPGVIHFSMTIHTLNLL